MSKLSIKSDLARIDGLTDDTIDYSDIPPLDASFYKKATAAWPPAKKQLTLRLDQDVLEWLRASGKGYQTRINHILRAAMEHPVSRSPATKKAASRSRPRELAKT